MPERYVSPSLRKKRRVPAISAELTGVEAAIHDRIWNAILDRKLRPGVKLHEDIVGTAFGVSRTIVRKVFLIMEQEGIVSLPLNRGAFVATPAPEDIGPMFETLRLIMPYLIRGIAGKLDEAEKARLEAHFAIEPGSDPTQEARILRRLAQEHFILLADLYGNPVLAKVIERITLRVSMAMTLYLDPISHWWSADSERAVNLAIVKGDAEKAVELMLTHLDAIEKSMQFGNSESSYDIGAILSPEEDEVYPKARRSGKGRQAKASIPNDNQRSAKKTATGRTTRSLGM